MRDLKEEFENIQTKDEVIDNINEEIKEEILEIKPKRVVNKIKEKECKVLARTKEFTIVDFDGYGITVDITEDKTVVVKYTGTIGSADFTIIK